MPPVLRLEVFETHRFTLDCAFYGLDEESLRRAVELLVSDPAIGDPLVGNPALWCWQFGGHDLIYAISGDFSKLVLLELQPHAESSGKLAERIFDTLDRIDAIKRLFGL